VIRAGGSFPNGPFKFLRKESYKRSPLIGQQIQEDGTMSDALLGRSSGVAGRNRKFLEAIENWRYQRRPAGCGAIDIVLPLTIDWASSG
jgi:hypothetical protein